MSDRFIIFEAANGRWHVKDRFVTRNSVRSSHVTQERAQEYADRYNALHRERIKQTALAKRAAKKLKL